jgi:hypothetical protein
MIANAECQQCLAIQPLLMPVEQAVLDHRYTEHLCVKCRLSYDRATAMRWYQGRLEGRRRLPHAGSRRLCHQPQEHPHDP